MLIMELPPYKRPLVRVVVRHMWDRSKLFLRRAGTVILGINILLWFLATYPHAAATQTVAGGGRARLTSQLPAMASADQSRDLASPVVAMGSGAAGARLRQSFAGHLGRLIEPIIAPLGFDWKIGIGIITSFAAREVFVSTMSTVYNVGKTDATAESMTSLAQTLQAQRRPDGTPVYTPLTAVTLMVFYVFALQCVSTVAIVRRETNSWKWPFFQWLYMGVLAWGSAFLTHLGGGLLGLH
jgi:ferrous iron transport protein B